MSLRCCGLLLVLALLAQPLTVRLMIQTSSLIAKRGTI